ncbi:MAG: serine protease AprX [Chloroflexota bacterium]|nr:serine protease AprX [Chloroflexota bacterium]
MVAAVVSGTTEGCEKMTLTIVVNGGEKLRAALAACACLVVVLLLGGSGAPATGRVVNPAVTAYLDQGTAPAGSATVAEVPLIVETDGDPAALQAFVQQRGGHIDQGFKVLHGFVATVPPEAARALNHDDRVSRLSINAPVRLLGSAVNPANLANRYDVMNHTPAAWRNGLDGSEVQVAVLDSGVYPHDDLTLKSPFVPGNGGNRLLAMTTNPRATDAIDHVGHGTHVAGIIAGNGYDSNGQYIGEAPNSLVVSVKVSDDQGNLTEADVITGLEWVYVANQKGFTIRVVNLSLASTVAQGYNQSSLDAMVEKLWFSGVVVVAASGNGNGAGGVTYAPGNDPYVITVGSIEDNFQLGLAGALMAPWATYGKTQDGFAKPEVVADGSHVVSLLAPGSSAAADHPGSIVAGSYLRMGGTSMAAPVVAGLAALAIQANPKVDNDRLKSNLVRSSRPFSLVAYTPALGLFGGFADAAVLTSSSKTNVNRDLKPSAFFHPDTNEVYAGGTWWADATWPDASWNSTSWNSTSWNSTSWNSTSWNGTDFSSTSWNSTSWNSTSWNSTSWNSTSWNSTSWNSTSWNSTSWSSADTEEAAGT